MPRLDTRSFILLFCASLFTAACDGEALVDDGNTTSSTPVPSDDPMVPGEDPMNPGPNDDPMNPGDDPMNPGDDPMNPGDDPMNPDPMGDPCNAGFVGGAVYSDVVDANGIQVAFAWTEDNCSLMLQNFSWDFSLSTEPVVRIFDEDGTLVSDADLDSRLYDNENLTLTLSPIIAGDVPVGPHLGQYLHIVDLAAPDETYITGTLWAP